MKLYIYFTAIFLNATPTLATELTMIDQGGYRSDFKALDIDSNDYLSYAEASKEKIFVDGFSKADKNKNNKLSYDEYAAYKSEMQDKESKRVLNDSAITSKIKSKFLIEIGIKSFKVKCRNQSRYCGAERYC